MDFDEFLAAPEIVRRLLSQDAFENETVTFSCTVQNVGNANEEEPFTITWFFNDKQIQSNTDRYIIDENSKTGICLLTIKNIGADDEGSYRCVATNKFGSSVTTGFLAVLRRKRSQSPSPSRNASPNRSLSPSSNRLRDRSVSPLRYINLPYSKLARVTEELENLINPLASTVHEEETENVVPEDKEATPISSIIETEQIANIPLKEPSPTKIIEPEQSIVLPIVEETQIDSSKKEEQSKPVIIRKLPLVVRITEGEDLDVSCSIAGVPEPTIRWTKDNADIREDHRVDIYSDRGAHHLEISEVLTSDAGQYTIYAENSLGKISAECQIEVLENTDKVKRLKVEGLYAYGARQQTYKAPEFLIKPANRTIHEGEQFQIFAKVIGNPAPQVLWVRLGKALEDDDGYHRIYDRNGENYFEIPKISILDAGEYSCIATNMMGAAYSTFIICVEAMTEPESTGSEIEERSANVSDVDTNVMEDFPESIASQLIDKHVRQHRQLKLSDQSDVDYFFSDFVLKDDFRDEARDVYMNKGDMVEIVDIDKQDKWLVRNKKNLNQICYVPREYLEMVPDTDISPAGLNLTYVEPIQPLVPSKRTYTKKSGVVANSIDKRYNPTNQEDQDSSSSSDDLKTMTEEAEVYFANSDYVPTRPDGISLAENQLVDVLDSHDPEQYLVRTRARKDERPKIGWVDACFLEKKSTNIGQIIMDIVVVVAAAATDFFMFSRKSVIHRMRRVLSFVDI
ncbi:unnamed protein product [Adineta ricciae]|uniref:Uncharacterized protein n=1 Tax=Adineta ricciae TaxID=249248 RepID=A0A814USQ0_ADIRI|nr:unnamed protein product [Adineta ricciae]CAF1602821.1 unnamed protein product [Adineta ricciae]